MTWTIMVMKKQDESADEHAEYVFVKKKNS